MPQPQIQLSTGSTDNAIALELVPLKAMVLRCEELQFNLASHIVTPRGLSSIVDAVKHAMEHPERKCVVTCHTDSSDDDTSNQKLSERRAKMILSIMENNGDAFAMLALANEYKTQSSWEASQVADIVELFTCKTPNLGGYQLRLPENVEELSSSSKLADAYKALNGAYNAATNKPAGCMPIPEAMLGTKQKDAWKWVHSLYVKWIRFEADVEKMPDWQWADPQDKVFGYGEKYLLEKNDVGNDSKMRKNRHADFVFFYEDQAPKVDPGKGSETFETLYKPAKQGTNDVPYNLTTLGCREQPQRFHKVYIIDFSGSMEEIDKGKLSLSSYSNVIDPVDLDYVVLTEEDEKKGKWIKEPVNGRRPAFVSRLDVAKARLRREITELGDQLYFAMVGFSDGPLTTYPANKTLVKVADKRGEAIDWIGKNIKAKSSTDLESALTWSFDVPGVEEFYVITDGMPNVPSKRYETHYQKNMISGCKALAQSNPELQHKPANTNSEFYCGTCYRSFLVEDTRTKRRQKKIVLNVFALVDSKHSKDLLTVAFLKQLARAGGGSYTEIGT